MFIGKDLEAGFVRKIGTTESNMSLMWEHGDVHCVLYRCKNGYLLTNSLCAGFKVTGQETMSALYKKLKNLQDKR